MILGEGEYRYRKADGWGSTVGGHPLPGMVVGVAVDSRRRLLALCRVPEDEPAVLLFDLDGNFVSSWGAGIFTEPHGIWVNDADEVFTADRLDHTVRKFSPDGELLMTIGTPGKTGDPGMPFNGPAKAVCSRSGDIFVADGYGQNRVHRFTSKGDLVLSWGSEGSGDDQFILPHGIWVDDRDRVLVADRMNSRVTLFDLEGRFLETWPVNQPNDIFIRDGIVYVTEEPLALLSMEGESICHMKDKGTHTVCVDQEGSFYITYGHTKDDALLEKYERIGK